MFILTLHCKDQPGVVAAVATSLANADCNIEESAQFNDKLSGCFFMRVVFKPHSEAAEQRFQENWQETTSYGSFRQSSLANTHACIQDDGG